MGGTTKLTLRRGGGGGEGGAYPGGHLSSDRSGGCGLDSQPIRCVVVSLESLCLGGS